MYVFEWGLLACCAEMWSWRQVKKGTDIKRLAGRRGRKVGKSTKDDRERNQNCEQKAKENPERTEENKGKQTQGRQVLRICVGCSFHITGGKKRIGHLCSFTLPPFFSFHSSLLSFPFFLLE